MNLINFLTGRKTEVYGTVKTMDVTVHGETKSVEQPLIVLATRRHWFGEKRWSALDAISFLLVAEKLRDAPSTKDFMYDNMHETCHVKVVIPAWAVEEMQSLVAVKGPIVYEQLKKLDSLYKKTLSLLKSTGASEEAVKALESTMPSPLTKYQQLHAQLHGYVLPVGGNDTIN